MSIIRAHVDRMYRAAPKDEQFYSDPVFGAEWLKSAMPMAKQKKGARRALLAREWFYLHGPSDAPPLPLDGEEQADLKYRDPLAHLVTQFSKSLAANGWDIHSHPSFKAYARGVMASPLAADLVRNDDAMRKRYPPRELQFILSGMIWRPVSSWN